MFTGLIQTIGKIAKIVPQKSGIEIAIESDLSLKNIKIGASIACSGACLTITKKRDNIMIFEASQETIDKTNISEWKDGTFVNLETSLKMGDEIGGNLVSGHVDGTITLQEIENIGEHYKLTFNLPKQFQKFIAQKGSVALNGVSLTVNNVGDDCFDVNIIPHTWENTCFKFNNIGDAINLEIDMIARYVERQL